MLRIAVIGAGRIGKIHAGNVASHPRARLVAVVDPVEAGARALAQQHGSQWATQAQDLIAGKDIDAIVVGSPTNTHIDLIEQAAAAGKAVLCEKPIDLDIAKVNRCLENLKKTPVPLLVGFNRRFDPSADALKRAILDGEVGQGAPSHHLEPRPGSSAAVLRGHFGRAVPRHDHPRLRHGPLAAGGGTGRGVCHRQLSGGPDPRRPRRLRHRDGRDAHGERQPVPHQQLPAGGVRIRPAPRGVRFGRHAAERQPALDDAAALRRRRPPRAASRC